MQAVAATLLAFCCGLVLVPLVRAVARRTGMVCAPRADRWHATPTALLGGVGIAGACALAAVPFAAIAAQAWAVLAAAALLFAMGLIDDLVQLRPLTKLGGQLVAAALVVGAGHVLPWTGSALANAAITVVWMVGITNAMNLLDNMDGLAAGIAAIAAVFLAVTFVLNGQHALAVLPALLVGACAAFLVFNVRPASIFMGDCGSMFLGGLLGGLALLSSYGRSRSVASVLLTPVLIMAIPILDTTLVTVTRKLRGQPVSQGGRDHTSHRLVALGASERRAVVILYLLATMSGAVAIVVRRLGTDALLAVIPAFTLLMLLFALYVHAAVRVVPDDVPRARGARWPRIAAQVALDVPLAAVAYVSAYLVRWDVGIPPSQWAILVATLPVVVTCEVAALLAGRLYATLWRHPRVEDLLVIARAACAGAGVAAGGILVLYRFSGPSRGVLVMNALLWLVALTASRLGFRLLDAIVAPQPTARPGAAPVLVYGIGRRAASVVQAVHAHDDGARTPIGFLAEDDTAGAHHRLHGLPVYPLRDLAALVRSGRVAELIVPDSAVAEPVATLARELGLPLSLLRVELARVR